MKNYVVYTGTFVKQSGHERTMRFIRVSSPKVIVERGKVCTKCVKAGKITKVI